MESRRSMGTSKPWTQPKRSSSTGISLAVSGTGASCMSKLPKPKTLGPSSSHKSRSSSIESHSARRATSVSRSPSKNRTPLRASRHLMPLSGANSGGSMRGYGGRESMTPNRRETVKVAVKDNRPLADKQWQQEKTREIIDFCRNENYPGTLMPNNFTLSSSEFRKLFEFLMQFLVPDFIMPKLQDMGLELPPLLKKLGYPGTISKATFQTIGTQHSWAATLGMLSYLLLRARACIHSNEDIEKMIYQNLEDPLEEECDKILFEHFSSCYDAFRQGVDDYNAELDNLEANFRRAYSVENNNDEMEHELHNVESEYTELKQSSCNVEQLQQAYKDKLEDVKKMEDYCAQCNDHLISKTEDRVNQAKVVDELERKLHKLRNSVTELDKLCREEKGVNPDEASGLEYAVNELERQVAQKKKALEEASAVLWKTEQALSKRNVAIDHLCSQFNLTLMELKIENVKTFVLGREKPLDDVKSKLTNLSEKCRQNEKSLKELSARNESELSTLKGQLNRKVGDVKKNEEELRKRKDEAEMSQRKIDEELRDLSKALEDAKEKMIRHSERDKRDLQALEVEMERLQGQLTAVREERQAKVREGMELLEQTNVFAMEEHERRMTERKEAIKLYKERVKEIVTSLVASKKEVKDFLNGIPKFK